jgi:hypothetical protein
MQHSPSGTTQNPSGPGCDMLDHYFLSDVYFPWSSTAHHTALSFSVWHPNEGKEEPQYPNMCKNQATNMRDTQFQ